MKAKRLAPLALLLPLALLSACGGAVGLTLTANWYSDPTHVNIQNGTETLVYKVAYTPDTDQAAKAVASFSYDEGTYTATLQERSTLSGYAQWAEGKGYVYHTELKIGGSYRYAGTETETPFEDTVVSDVAFMNVNEMLRPVWSEKRYKVTSYYAGSAVTQYDYTYTATYNEDLSETKIKIADHRNVAGEESISREETIRLGGGTFFDNEEILVALRALDLSASFSFSTVNPVTLERMDVSMAAASKEVSQEGSYTVNGEKIERGVSALAFSIGYTATKSGMTQNLIYAAPSEKQFRCALIEMTTLAPDGAGMFTYTLQELTSFDN